MKTKIESINERLSYQILDKDWVKSFYKRDLPYTLMSSSPFACPIFNSANHTDNLMPQSKFTTTIIYTLQTQIHNSLISGKGSL